MSEGMKLMIPDEQIHEYVAQAILHSLDAEAKNMILAEAIKQLNMQKGSGYGPSSSPLQDAFNRAVVSVANTQVMELVKENSDFQRSIREVVQQGVERWLGLDKEKLVEKIAESITKALATEKW